MNSLTPRRHAVAAGVGKRWCCRIADCLLDFIAPLSLAAQDWEGNRKPLSATDVSKSLLRNAPAVLCLFPAMTAVTDKTFGLLIAYLLPGFICLWGVSHFSPTVQSWLGAATQDAPTLGGFLYVTVASIGAGLTASTVRWLLIDTLHHWTGIRAPSWDFSKLQRNVAAFQMLVEIHYRYYQFYGNGFIAIIFAWTLRRVSIGFLSGGWGLFDVGSLVVSLVLLAGSRDTLRKYYARTTGFLDSSSRSRRAKSTS